VTRAYLEQHGKSVAFYSKEHGVFRVNSKDAVDGDGITQFGRALLALNIDIICASSPQAKGRVAETKQPGAGTIFGAAWISTALYSTSSFRSAEMPKPPNAASGAC
jgi:hypothetical protein